MFFQTCLITSPASIAAEAWVLTHLSPPCPTEGCMVLFTYSFEIITIELTVANDRCVLTYLVSWKSVPVAGF